MATGQAPVVKPPAPRTSPRRLVVAGLIALLASALFWTGALLWVGSRPAGRQRNAAEDARRAEILRFVHEGKQAGESGNWLVAAYYFGQAETLEPKAKRIHDLRAAAEQKSRQQSSQEIGRASVIAMGLDNANKFLAAQSYDGALMAATEVLRIDPQNADARAIMVKAQEGQAAKRKQRRPSTSPEPAPGEIASTAPVTSEQTARPSAPAAHPEATTATLRIHFRSEVPEATVIVYANRKEVFRHTYGGGGGLFHKQAAGTIDETATATPLPAGRRRGRGAGSRRSRGSSRATSRAGAPGRWRSTCPIPPTSRWSCGRDQVARSGCAARGSPSGDQTVTGPIPSNCGSRISAGPTATTATRSGSRWRRAISRRSSRVTAATLSR